LASALTAGLAVGNVAQAQQQPPHAGLGPVLDNTDRLGDAAIFQYYTAKQPWQTFIRLINTSSNAIVVKVRFREAANSREVLDFAVALSPYDMWAAWTDSDAFGDGSGPGIRTRDRSCLFPPVGQGGDEGWIPIPTPTLPDRKAALFKDKAFTGPYFDGNDDVDARLREGHIEVIGVAQYDPDGDSRERDFAAFVTHTDTGYPNNCGQAWSLLQAEGTGEGEGASGEDMDNVLAANAYLINVPSGQGAGYNPDILYNCSDNPRGSQYTFEREYNSTDTSPDLDSCTAGYWGIGPAENSLGVGPIAVNQRRSDGSEPSAQVVTQYAADLNRSGTIQPGVTAGYDLDADGFCTGDPVPGFNYDESAIPEDNVPESLYTATANTQGIPNGGSIKIVPYAANGCQYQVVQGGGDDFVYVVNTIPVDVILPWRVKQKGHFLTDNSDYGGNRFPVTGGVDNVSQEFMRRSVINEWAAAYNPAEIVTEYFTQWVLTFPTKHYYVDLQDDPIVPPPPGTGPDDISPTLIELDGEDAFAPFTEEFDEGEAGKSCELYNGYIWNREERRIGFTSPAPDWEGKLCWETNVLNFGEDFAVKGLNSSFAETVPNIAIPFDVNHDGSFSKSQRGWAQLDFVGPGTYIGLGDPYFDGNDLETRYNWFGLPVTGFMFSVYNTAAGPNQNHTTINEHKYVRDIDTCSPGSPSDPCPTFVPSD
jgi:hypothetical protein